MGTMTPAPRLMPSTKPAELILSRPANRSTAAKLRVLIETYAKSGRLLQACETAGIGFKTHYRRLESDPAYRQAFEEAEQQACSAIEDVVYGLALAGDLQAATLLLKRFKPDAYRERISTDTTITVNLVDRMTAANERLLTLRCSEPDGSDNS